MGKVFIAQNIVKQADRIDINGNIVDPRTKRVLVPKESDSIAQPTDMTPTPTPQPLPNAPETPITAVPPKDEGLSVLEQITATKQKLAELEELKKAEIAKKKKELELLEQ